MLTNNSRNFWFAIAVLCLAAIPSCKGSGSILELGQPGEVVSSQVIAETPPETNFTDLPTLPPARQHPARTLNNFSPVFQSANGPALFMLDDGGFAMDAIPGE